MTVPKPTLPAYSPGHATGYTVSGADYDNDTLQQGARTQLLIEPVTTFPASPAATDWCFRSDLNALYQCTNATGPVWNQMSVGSLATTARPAAPPTSYRYVDLTDGATKRWNGSAYIVIGRTKIADVAVATDVYTAFTTTAATQNNLATVSFTPTDPNSLIEIDVTLGITAVAAAGPTNAAVSLFLDSTTRFGLSANDSVQASQPSYPTGGALALPSAITAAAHSVVLQLFTQSAFQVWFRCSSVPQFEYCRVQVFETIK